VRIHREFIAVLYAGMNDGAPRKGAERSIGVIYQHSVRGWVAPHPLREYGADVTSRMGRKEGYFYHPQDIGRNHEKGV
jgi:hypothetical protein